MTRRAVIALAVLAAACASHRAGQTPPAPSATADLLDATGTRMGTAEITALGADSIEIRVNTRGLAPGPHGVHLHAIGHCDAPAFASAGGHLNPAGRQHGLDNPAGPHAGDMPNLEEGRLRTRLPVSFASLFDADGTAVVVHAARDDQRTEPSGNSGARILCGVLTAR